MSDETIAETMERSEAGSPPDEALIEIIAGRRKKIRGDAEREGCGARLADPRGLCDQDGAVAVDGAVIMTRARAEAEAGYHDGKPYTVTARFDQREWWRRKTGEWVRIADMSVSHRYNTAAMLMRNAAHHAFAYSMSFGAMVARHDGGDMAHDALERMDEEITRQSICDPRGWLAGTALYRALTDGLSVQGDGTQPWQATRRDPVTGEPRQVPARFVEAVARAEIAYDAGQVCGIPDCGCSGKAHA